MKLPSPLRILELIDAFRRSKTMFAAVALGVFDRVPVDCATLARELDAHPGALERLLDASVGLKLLRKDGAVYRNRPVAETYLRRSSPHTMTGYILYSNNALFRLWANLEDAVREGTPRWEQTFGGRGALFDHFFKTDEAMRDFLMGMNGFGQLSSPAVVEAFDLSRFHRLADLGGATGHLALAACERYPGLRAVVFDLPRVIDYARRIGIQPSLVEFLAGDFFEDPLPEADLFAVGRILHDWGDGKVRRLLRKIHDRLPSGGALLVAERLLAGDKSGPVGAHMQSLNMLVCTEGKERTLAEYRGLLEEAGFREVEGRITGAPLDAVLALR
ncbi:MAG: class I SAM-dependent methyltransferase [Bryobacteraceae bacterium]|jgi:acetylserotonin N-methyltransferase